MPNVWDQAAAVFRYPDERYLEALRACRRSVCLAAPEAAAPLGRFADAMAALSPEAQQEQFTATFDLNPACALEVGWHLFGENYERGAFLVKMRRLLTRFGVPDGGELPDHLGAVLTLLGRMPADEAAEFAGACVLPALAKMRTHLAGKSNPFESLLDAIVLLVEAAAVFRAAPHPAAAGRGNAGRN
ncbi:MAG: nitrate reductase molybdenum cofactor assembly chaperone [Candidatus Methylomirabilales bacterium]